MSSYPKIWNLSDGRCFAKYAPNGPWVLIQVSLPPKIECRTKSDRKRERERKQKLEAVFDQMCAANRQARLLAAAIEVMKINEQGRRADVRRYATKSCFYVLMTILWGLLTVAALATPFTLFSLAQIGQAFLVMLLLFGCGIVGLVLTFNTITSYVAAHLSASIAIQKERS